MCHVTCPGRGWGAQALYITLFLVHPFQLYVYPFRKYNAHRFCLVVKHKTDQIWSDKSVPHVQRLYILGQENLQDRTHKIQRGHSMSHLQGKWVREWFTADDGGEGMRGSKFQLSDVARVWPHLSIAVIWGGFMLAASKQLREGQLLGTEVWRLPRMPWQSPCNRKIAFATDTS